MFLPLRLRIHNLTTTADYFHTYVQGGKLDEHPFTAWTHAIGLIVGV